MNADNLHVRDVKSGAQPTKDDLELARSIITNLHTRRIPVYRLGDTEVGVPVAYTEVLDTVIRHLLWKTPAQIAAAME